MKRFDREEIEKMKYVAKNLMTFFNSVCLSLSGSLRAFLPLLSSCVSLFCPFWVSACLSNSPPSGTPTPVESAFKFCAALPPAAQACGPSGCDLHQLTIKTQFYRGLLLCRKGELSIAFLLLLDKGGHVTKRKNKK